MTDTTTPAPTVAESLACATRRLSDHSESPRLDAALLLCEVTGMSRSASLVRGDEPLSAAHRAAFDVLISRRAGGAPVAYLTGEREFWSLRLGVTPDVLVPRPETEVLVAQTLALLPDQPRRLLDLGTGSGAIALAISSERPRTRIAAVDVSAAAVAVARRNARALGLSRIDWRVGSWYAAVAGEHFDIIVANPPYVAAGDPALQRLAAEPLLALTPGPTGLEALSIIIAGAAAHLRPQGWLLLEHGNAQAGAVARLLDAAGFRGVRTHADFAGQPRVTLAAGPLCDSARAPPDTLHSLDPSQHHSSGDTL